MAAVFHVRRGGKIISITNNLRKKKLHRTNQDSTVKKKYHNFRTRNQKKLTLATLSPFAKLKDILNCCSLKKPKKTSYLCLWGKSIKETKVYLYQNLKHFNHHTSSVKKLFKCIKQSENRLPHKSLPKMGRCLLSLYQNFIHVVLLCVCFLLLKLIFKKYITFKTEGKSHWKPPSP